MFERFYTTQMSGDAKKLKVRFEKITSKNRRSKKLVAACIAVVIIALICATAVMAMTDSGDNIGENEVITFAPPLYGEITASFGTRTHPITGETMTHSGIDIRGETGDEIRASADGVVTEVSFDADRGNYVRIKHGGGYETLYAHCSEVTVKVGDKVRSGDVIAKVGMTGSATGAHLHFEVLKDGVPQAPRTMSK